MNITAGTNKLTRADLLPLERYAGQYQDPWYGRITVAPGATGLTIDFNETPRLSGNGRIVEQGTHAELLRHHGKYYRLYTQQFRHERTAALATPEMDFVGA